MPKSGHKSGFKFWIEIGDFGYLWAFSGVLSSVSKPGGVQSINNESYNIIVSAVQGRPEAVSQAGLY